MSFQEFKSLFEIQYLLILNINIMEGKGRYLKIKKVSECCAVLCRFTIFRADATGTNSTYWTTGLATNVFTEIKNVSNNDKS